MTVPWMVAFCLLSAVVLIQGVFTLGLGKRMLDALGAVSDASGPTAAMRVGMTAPPLSGRYLAGVAPVEFLGHRTVVLFVDDGCSPCRRLVDELLVSPPALGDVQLVVAFDEDHDIESSRFSDAVSLSRDANTTAKWHAYATPQAYVVDETGVIQLSEIVNAASDIRSILSLSSHHPIWRRKERENDISLEHASSPS